MTGLLKIPFLLFALLAFALPAFAQDSNWNRFRGPNGTGVVTDTDLAQDWSAEKNTLWKTELPGPGSSSPIVQGDKVFVTCYTGYGVDSRNPGNPGELKRHLLCFDRGTGKELWRDTIDSVVDEDEYRGFITDHGYASSTPVSNDELVFGFFGKSGVVAWDLEGNRKWQTSVGTFSDPAKWGAGASPMLYKDLVIVNAGIEGHTLIALNQSDGSEAWRVDDEKFTNSWSTPVLVDTGRPELIYSVPGRILAFNPDNGEELWSAQTPIKDAITASVVANDGIVYTLGGRQGKALAVRCGGSGDVTETHTVWTQPVTSSIGTPIVYGEHLYWLGAGGIATCLNLKDGTEANKKRLEAPGPKRFPNSSYASPIVVDDKMIVVRRSGTVHVVKATPDFEIIADNVFEDDESRFSGTPAVADGQMFIRSDGMLYCIAKDG